MQTLTLGMALPGDLGRGRGSHALNQASGYSATAFYRLEAPMVAPLAESSAWIDIVLLHPTVDDLEGRRALKVEHDVSIWDVELVFDHDPVRRVQDAGLSQRVYDSA